MRPGEDEETRGKMWRIRCDTCDACQCQNQIDFVVRAFPRRLVSCYTRSTCFLVSANAKIDFIVRAFPRRLVSCYCTPDLPVFWFLSMLEPI
jgi:hypothetical protein